jgi:hypothetical protein
MHRLLIALSFTACTATVRTAGPPPSEPAPPPPAPVVVRDHRTEPQPPPPPPAEAPPAGPHAAYLRALSDLRAARGYLLNRPKENVEARWDEKRAVNRINDAIQMINEAAISDGKPIDEHPPIDVNMMWAPRLDKALELVLAARRDVDADPDNTFGKALKPRLLKALDQATNAIRDGIEDAKAHPAPPPGPGPGTAHPAYAAAQVNLRHARALLERPATMAPDVKFDQNLAIREIDSALKEIRDAKQDDGQPVTEHPPIDSKLAYADRLQEAVRLLDEAIKDLEEKEDNAWAKKDRKNAIEHARRAEKAARTAIHDRKGEKPGH